MKIIVFGATGSIGRHVVDQALAQGHEVSAFARQPSQVEAQHPRLRVLQGDATNPSAVESAVAGQDAVIVTLGAGRQGGIRADATLTIIQTMQRAGTNRLIVQSTLGTGDSWTSLNFFWKRIMFGLVLRKAYADHVAQEAHVTRSELDWTIVRSAAFVDGPRTGRYRHGFSHPDRSITMKIARADVADFVLKQLTDDTYLRQAPGLSY